MKLILKICGVLLGIGMLVPFLISYAPVSAHPPAQATPYPKFNLKDPCPRDPNNLIKNGTMREEHPFAYGTLADNWDAFIFDGSPPAFRRVDNEGIDGSDSQQIVSTNTFDAGIMQTVSGLQPGTYYMFRFGYSLAAKSWDGPNVRVNSIGRKVGVDPFGGNDPHSPNVIWGPDYFNGVGALNLPEMMMIFSARSDRATIFLRAMARDGSGGENRVWLDAVCMEARPEIPPATLPPPPTALPSPSATTRPSPTRTRTPANTATRTATPTLTLTPTPRATATPTVPPLRARPQEDVPSGFVFEIEPGVLAGIGVGSIAGACVFLGLGLVTLKKSL